MIKLRQLHRVHPRAAALITSKPLPDRRGPHSSDIRTFLASPASQRNANGAKGPRLADPSRCLIGAAIRQQHRSLSSSSSESGLSVGMSDLLGGSLAHGRRRKIVLDGHSSTGFDVAGMDAVDGGDLVHVMGSCIAFPHACYLWRPTSPREVTVESLAVVEVHDPKIDILLIGCDTQLPPRLLNIIRKDFASKGTVVEQTDVFHACSSFNILNGEDRNVAVALVCDGTEKDE